MIGAVTRRPMTVDPTIVPRQQPIEGGQGVVIGAGAELQDCQTGRRVWHEDGQEAVPSPAPLGDEPPAGRRQVGEAPLGPGPDLEPDALYGKMLRRASRSRPIPPIAGADS